MKPQKNIKKSKLSLGKKSISNLNSDQMRVLNGGNTWFLLTILVPGTEETVATTIM